jgi:hypothetical protein
MSPTLTSALASRLEAIAACPVCGARRTTFEDYDRQVVAVFACGAYIVAIGAAFIVPAGCKVAVADKLARIKIEEEAKLVEDAEAAPCHS